MITAYIKVRNLDEHEEQDVFAKTLEDDECVHEFVQTVKEDEGVWLGADFFIPYGEITEFFFAEEADADEETV